MKKTTLMLALLTLFALTMASSTQADSPVLLPSPQFKVSEIRVISWKPPLYHGWPTLSRRANGELLLAFSGGREKHVCPFGRLEWMRSSDNGKTWGWPQVLYDSPIDDRDAGVVETSKGAILVTNFTSLAYETVLKRAEKAQLGEPGSFADSKLLEEWQAAHRRLNDEDRKREVGSYIMRSTDGGVTWSVRCSVPVNSPHGPINLHDGRVLYPGKALWKDGRIGVCESKDDGQTWDWLSQIPTREGDSDQKYHELHAVEAANGTIVCHIRNENEKNPRETLQSESSDGGRTWSIPHPIGVWGLPSHLLKMAGGALLMTYGHRRAPIGIQARVSRDHGATWSEAMKLSTDGISSDIGYPSTVEADDGSLVTAWYEVLPGSPLAQLRQARWSMRR